MLKVKRRDGEDFILIGEKEWQAIEETIFLNQIPDLVKSIQEVEKEPIEMGTPLEELDW